MSTTVNATAPAGDNPQHDLASESHPTSANSPPSDSVDKATDSTKSHHSFFSGLTSSLARPIVQKRVRASIIGIESVVITDPTETSFVADVVVTITKTGRVDSKFSAPEGLIVSWSGSPIGKLHIPDVDLVGGVGGKIVGKCNFEITDVKHATEFFKTALISETFDWIITGSNIVVKALGITVSGIDFGEKKVTLKGFNGAQTKVTIKSFDLPSEDPAGGIRLSADTSVASPAQLGLLINKTGFQLYKGDIHIGSIVSSSPTYKLLPNATSEIPFIGRLIPQTSSDGLAAVSRIFTDCIHGKPVPVFLKAEFAGPESVTWLNEAWRILHIETSLPSHGKVDVIQSIEVDEWKVHIGHDIHSPLASVDDLITTFKFPFSFPLDIIEIRLAIGSSYEGKEFVTSQLQPFPARTEVDKGIVHLKFEEVPISVPHKDLFVQFLKHMTTSGEKPFIVSGSMDIKAKTAIGVLAIDNIVYSLEAQMSGADSIVDKLQQFTLDALHLFPHVRVKVRAKLNPNAKKDGT